MRIVSGSGKNREVLELPGLAVRARDPEQHQQLIRNLQDRACHPEYALERKGVRVYH